MYNFVTCLVTRHGIENQIYWAPKTCNYKYYSAIANSHTVQFTTAYTKSSQSAVFSSFVW
jgi:hypothetical protein